MKRYIAGGSDSPLSERDFAFIEAESDEEVRAIYGREIGTGEDLFIEYIYDRSVNSSFAEHFWMQTPEEQETFSNTGEVTADEETFKRRVMAYFKGRPDFANLYLEFYFSDEDPSEVEPFPDEMMLWMYLTSWGKDLEVIPVSEIQRLP